MIYPGLEERQSVKNKTKSSKLLILQFTSKVSNIYFLHQFQYIVSGRLKDRKHCFGRINFGLNRSCVQTKSSFFKILLNSVTKLTKNNGFSNMS